MPPGDDYSSIYHPVDQDGHPYVGLVNQAMTCYLNSLLQTLFMTPEFRNILYQWQYNGTMDEATRSIPFQLQKLFALLQTTNKYSLETRDLTASFGWEGSDAYEQHDVQELSRVMLEALEHRFRKSEKHRTFIENLYKGTMEDVIKCLGCRREKVREDIYNDLALAIREFGATESYKSVEEALTAFIKPELLTDSNKYNCENCGGYKDAEKGFRFTAFPHMLAIQLKRFTLDYSTGFRVKLNDRMTFPDYLDLNDFIYKPGMKPVTKAPKPSYAAVTKSPPQTIKEEEEMKSQSSLSHDADGWLNKPPNCPEVQEMLKKGKYVYELFAILIHQGSATGGHYFAYIKNLEQSKWLCFNDTQVKAVDIDEVKKSFGGSGWSSNMNGYMMVYRQVDPEKNQKFTRRSELPAHVVNWLKQWEEEENRQAYEQSRIDSMVKVKVVLNDDRNLTDEMPYGAQEWNFSKEDKGRDIIELFAGKFNEMGIYVDPNTAILIPARSNGNFAESHPIDLNKTIGELLSEFFCNSELTFVMELKEEEFLIPVADGLKHLRTLDFLTVDVSFNSVRMCKRVGAYDDETMGSIRERVSKLFPKCQVDGTQIRMVMDLVIDDGSPLLLIDDDSKTIEQLVRNKFQIPKFYIDCGLPDDLKNDRKTTDFSKTQMCKIMEKRKYGTRLRIQLPSASDYRQAGLRPPSNTFTVPPAPDPSPPVSPIAKKFCQLGHESAAAGTSNVNTRISQSNCHYTTASSSTTIISAPNYPYDSPMDRFIGNLAAASDPPSYDETMGKAHPASPIDGSLSNPPNYLPTDPYAEMEIDGILSSNVSPAISDDEENVPPEVANQGYNDCPTAENWQSSMDQDGNLANDGAFEVEREELYSDAYEDPKYTVDVIDTGYCNTFSCKYVSILVDHRQLTSKLVEWIARHLKLNPENIGLAKHYNDTDIKGYDMTLCPDETIKMSFASVSRVTVVLRVPTKADEKLFRVVDFDLNNENNPAQWPTLFHVAASSKTTVKEFKDKCLEILESAYAEVYPPERIRIREISNYGCPALNPESNFEARSFKDPIIALQKLKTEEVQKKKDDRHYQPIIVRRFCPSSLEIMAPFEVLVPEGDEKLPQILKNAIASHAKLAPERIGLSDLLPKGSFARWPFTKSALDLIDLPFADNVTFPVDYGGKLIYFIDKNETKKHITEEDRRAMRIKERISSNSNTARRTERPLRIQMSSISESDQ
ncbi:hypothetical protein FO519_004963 [Halicephalobus sp. NKZ332]|nr:hypothetical protein FO519_004963 [Halicephalobus sp. NKZ332]